MEVPTADNPSGTYRVLGTGQERKGKATGRGTQCRNQAHGAGAQILATEDGGWRVETKSRWTMIHAGRGCGERARESGEAALKATKRRAVGGGGT